MKYPEDYINKIICGDVLIELKNLPSESIDCCITSPPYWGLRDYGVKGQLGLEKTPEEYVAKMVEVFREVKRALKKEGTLWLNLGDSYSYGGRGNGGRSIKQLTNKGSWAGQAGEIWKVEGVKPKQLIGIPWRVAFALQSNGWYLRQDIIWAKPNPMPESVTDRCTKAHEYIFLLAKNQKYYFDGEAIKEPAKMDSGFAKQRLQGKSFKTENKSGFSKDASSGSGYEKFIDDGLRNKRSVWTVTTKPFKGAHFATFPEDLIIPMIKAGCPKDGIILDPFSGAGTTGLVAKKLQRNYIGIDLNPTYCQMARDRIEKDCGTLF